MRADQKSVQSELMELIEKNACNAGVWVTLNGLRTGKSASNAISFEQELVKFSNRLNHYCFGRGYLRGRKRLSIIGSIEIGHVMDRPHAHLMMLHGSDMGRTFEEMEQKCRQNWYEIINAKGQCGGNLVDVQSIGDIQSRLQYALKYYRSDYDKYCHLVML